MSRGHAGLARRLFLAQVSVVVASAATVALVAGVVGPRIFHEHLSRVGPMPAEAVEHIEQAYTSAGAISLGVALVSALLAALTASAYQARRIAKPVAAVAAAAAEIAGGHHAVRVPAPSLGRELDMLTTAFNSMAGRLEAIEATRRQMLGDLGHEMRTPLANLEAYLEAAEDGVSVPHEDAVQVMRTQTARLRRLAEDLSAVSRAEELRLDLQPRPLAPAALVVAATAAARSRYVGKNVALRRHVAPALPSVVADPERIGQALANLLDNALRHTPPGGHVTVEARPGEDEVHFVVSDTGEGIHGDHLPHLFERFYRADDARDPAHGGSGIGLAIVRAVVAAHGGKVAAFSAGSGEGATFTVTLPAANARKISTRRQAARANRHSSRL